MQKPIKLDTSHLLGFRLHRQHGVSASMQAKVGDIKNPPPRHLPVA